MMYIRLLKKRKRQRFLFFSCIEIAEKCLVSSNMVAVDQGEVRVLPLTYRVDHRTYSSTWGAVATEWNAAKDAGTISSYPWSSTNYPGYGVNSELHGNNLVLRANNNSWQGVPAEDTNITLNVITMGSTTSNLFLKFRIHVR